MENEREIFELNNRVAEVERVQGLMRTVINNLGSEVHDIADRKLYTNEAKSDYEHELDALDIQDQVESCDRKVDAHPNESVFKTAENALDDVETMVKDLIRSACAAAGVECIIEEDEADTVAQVEVWQCPEGNHHVALRFENDELEALADYDDEEVWNAREYAQKFAYREGLALFDKTAEGPVDQ